MNATESERTHADELAGMERPPRPAKVAEVERLEAVLRDSAAVFLTDFSGINVEMMNNLRRRFRDAGADFTIVKNTLLKRAADQAEIPDWIAAMEGPTALAVGIDDPVAPAKVIKGFQDEFKRQADFLVFKAGLLQGEAIDVDTFTRLATLPDRTELIARLLYLLTYPLRGLLTVLTGLPRNLVYALEDLRSKRAEAEPAAAGPVAGGETDAAETDTGAVASGEAAARGGDDTAEAGEGSAEETAAGADDAPEAGEAESADRPADEETTE